MDNKSKAPNTQPALKIAASVEKKTAPAATSTGLTQREAVFLEVTRVMKEDKIVAQSKQSVKTLLKEPQLNKIYEGLMNGFKAAKIQLKDNESNKQKLSSPDLLKTYVIGLVNNWIRRDERLNGKSESQAKS